MSRRKLRENDALLSRLVKAAPLRAAGPRVERIAGPAQAGKAVDVAEGDVVHARTRKLVLRDRAVGRRLASDLAVQRHDIERVAVLRGLEGGKRRRAARPGERRAPYPHAELGQRNVRHGLLRKDVYVFRRRKPRPHRTGAVPVVVARRDEHGDAHRRQRPCEHAAGFREHVLRIEKIAGDPRSRARSAMRASSLRCSARRCAAFSPSSA